jgi:mRNA interferase RelE/StbE
VTYEVQIPRRVQRDIDRLPTTDARRVYAAIYALKGEPRPEGSLKLTGRDAWRLRIGRYRVIYEVDDEALIVLVIDVGHRRDIYR